MSLYYLRRGTKLVIFSLNEYFVAEVKPWIWIHLHHDDIDIFLLEWGKYITQQIGAGEESSSSWRELSFL